MFFGSTPFASAPFSDVGVINITVEVSGNRVNISIGNTTIELITTVPVTGSRFSLATDEVYVVNWNQINPGATGVWVPIDPDNP